MKRRRVVWSRDALDEIKQAAAYIAIDNPMAGRRVAAAIRACGIALGRAATGRPGRAAGTYEKVVSRLPYILAYEILDLEGGSSVVILRVIHGARDWSADRWPNSNGEEQP